MRSKLGRWIITGLAVSAIAGCAPTQIISCVASFRPPAQFVLFDIPDAVSTHPRGVNNSGEIVGYFVDRQGPTRGFRGRPGGFTFIDLPGAFAVEAYAINNAGKIVLTGQGERGTSAFLLDGTSFIPLNKPPSVPVTNPRGVNDDDFVVGVYFDPPGVSHGYVYPPGFDPGSFGAINVFKDLPTVLNGINNTRRMVGSVLVAPFTSRAFYLAGPDIASAVIIEIAGVRIESSAHGINNAEDPACIKHVGTYHSRNGIDHGFVHMQAGQFARFDVPDAVHTRAFGINDRGDIVGEFEDRNRISHGFLATF